MVCLISIIVSEVFYERILENSDSKGFYYVLFLIIITYCFLSFMDNTEKYLLEYHKINAYKMIMIEGIFGFIKTSFYAIYEKYENPFKEIKYNYNNKKINFFLFFIFLLLYSLLSGVKNIYRILTNKKYSPMTKIMADSFLDPILIFYFFYLKVICIIYSFLFLI